MKIIITNVDIKEGIYFKGILSNQHKTSIILLL
jgi:hypothetical protein